MAVVSIAVVNPKSTDVTVNAKVAKAGTVTALSLDDATNESEQFLAAGCGLVSVAATGSTVASRAGIGYMMERLMHLQ